MIQIHPGPIYLLNTSSCMLKGEEVTGEIIPWDPLTHHHTNDTQMTLAASPHVSDQTCREQKGAQNYIQGLQTFCPSIKRFAWSLYVCNENNVPTNPHGLQKTLGFLMHDNDIAANN